MNGAQPPNAGLEEDSNRIRTYVESLVFAGREVLVLLHSYGGQVGTDALSNGLGVTACRAQGLPGGIVLLVYIAGFPLTEGVSKVDVVVSHGHGHLMNPAFDFAEDRTCISRDPRNLIVGPSQKSDEETDAYIATFQRWNGNRFDTKLHTVDRWPIREGTRSTSSSNSVQLLNSSYTSELWRITERVFAFLFPMWSLSLCLLFS